MGVWDEIKKEGLHALYILAIIIGLRRWLVKVKKI